MNLLIQLIGFAALGHLVTDFITWLDLPEVKEKPFKCDQCMTYWISVIPFMLQFGLQGILLAAISGIMANLIYKYL